MYSSLTGFITFKLNVCLIHGMITTGFHDVCFLPTITVYVITQSVYSHVMIVWLYNHTLNHTFKHGIVTQIHPIACSQCDQHTLKEQSIIY